MKRMLALLVQFGCKMWGKYEDCTTLSFDEGVWDKLKKEFSVCMVTNSGTGLNVLKRCMDK